MPSLLSILESIQPNDLLSSIDLTEAYLHIPILPDHRKFLRFSYEGKHFQYRALPFGLSSAPRVFTKILAALAAHLRSMPVRILCYLDDILLLSRSSHQALRNIQLTLQTLGDHSFLVNLKKSHLQPTTRLTHLGTVIDTSLEQVFLSPDRQVSIHDMVSFVREKEAVPFIQLSQLLGKMVSTFYIMPWARFHSRQLQWLLLPYQKANCSCSSHRIRLTSEVRRSLRWWLSLSQTPMHHTNYGRKSARVGSPRVVTHSPRSLVMFRPEEQYQLVGAESSVSCPPLFPLSCGQCARARPYGKYHHQSTDKPAGGDKIPASNDSVFPTDLLGGKPPVIAQGRAHIGGPKHSAITSARRVSELAALSIRQDLCIFHPDKVVLRLDLAFVPKVNSVFHRTQELVLPDFCSQPSHRLELVSLSSPNAATTAPEDALHPEDKHFEQSLVKSHQSATWAVKAASSFFNRAALRWLKQMQDRIPPGDSCAHQDINKLKAEMEYAADASLDAAHFSSRSMASNISTRHLLWLKQSQAETRAK
ncbi:PREDICTED: uncharacterized protein LOC106555206 [Thamnophis sirtalis]|uniref:ribonuclease H n=1 Tax=Thamnophis sirtalis TaxID=35019 RepID=A0A6I9Z0U7_9SAUR|nr:PREDICTED: uncharacterized protein LOC106555206 [Thamnophis sirtalis]